MTPYTEAKFKTGKLIATEGIANFINQIAWNHIWVDECLQRHKAGDWGDLEQEDKEANDQALENGDRLFSSYITDEGGTIIWIITDADRLHTTILFPHEY